MTTTDDGERWASWRGEPLPPALRRGLEAFFGEPLPEVRLHGGPIARQLTRRLGAAAMVLGRRVLFSPRGRRRFLAGGTAGVALIAHELVHVLQVRRQGRVGMLRRYLAGYVAGRRRGLGHDAAYRAIPHEVEAERWAAALAELLDGRPRIAGRIAPGGAGPTADDLARLAAAGRAAARRSRPAD